jgi:AraC-like DNA-binding protein
VLRFERACDLLRAAVPPAQVAAAAGYCDQSHLNREFAALAGSSPVRWRSTEFPYIQDRLAAAGAASAP